MAKDKFNSKSIGKAESKRKPDIIFLNVIFCLLVVFIHCASEIVSCLPYNNPLFMTVYSLQKLSMFVVPGFILLSGAKLFLRKSDNFNLGKYYLSRFFRIVVPYVFWAVIYYLYFCYTKVYDFNTEKLIQGILFGDIWAHFYFVIVLIQFIILAPVWRILYRKGSPAVHMTFAMLITAICAQYLPSILTTVFPDMPDFNVSNCFLRYQVYWTAGCLIGKNYTAFCDYLKSNKIIIFMGFILSGAIYVYLSLFTVGREPVWMELFGILYNCCAILFFYMLSQAFAGKASKALKPLTPIDRSTYTIYLVHCLVVVLANDYMKNNGITDLTNRFWIRLAVVYGVCFVFCILWQLIKLPITKLLTKERGERIV